MDNEYQIMRKEIARLHAVCREKNQVMADQRAEVERLRAALKNISSKITDDHLNFAGPSGLIHAPLSREEIDAIRAALGGD